MDNRLAAAFAGRDGKTAALMPYLMGGFPDLETSVAIGEAYADGGADLVELGVPFSDPLADGPLIHAAGTEALRAGVTPLWVLEVCASLAERLPVVVMAYANLVLGPGGFVDKAAAAGAAGLIVPDLPHDALLRVLIGHTSSVEALAVAPDGAWLASTGDDQTVRIWDPHTGHTRHTLTGHTSAVSALAIAFRCRPSEWTRPSCRCRVPRRVPSPIGTGRGSGRPARRRRVPVPRRPGRTRTR